MSITERIICFLAVCPWALVWFLLARYLRRHPQQSANYLIIHLREKLESFDVKKLTRFVSSAMFAGLPFILLSPWAPSTKLYYPLQFGLPILLALMAVLIVNMFSKRFCK